MKVKVIFNDIIPFKGFMAMCVWPFIFVRNDAMTRYGVFASNHEQIHGEQQKEMLVVGSLMAVLAFLVGCGWCSLLALPLFFWWYGIEWLFRIVQYKDAHTAYRNISFEREAYSNESDLGYLTHRKRFAWIHYLKQ